MNRADMLAMAADQINRKDMDAKMPGWLVSAEFRINNLLRDRRMVQRALLEIPADGYFTTPDDFLEAESLALQRYNMVSGQLQPGGKIGTPKYIPAEAIDEIQQAGETPVLPGWFTTRGRFLELQPWSSAAQLQAQLFYYAKLPKLTDDTSTNWFLDEAPHIYVSAVSHFAFKFLEEYDTADKYLQEVAAECTAINDRETEMKTFSGPLVRQRAPAIGVRRNR